MKKIDLGQSITILANLGVLAGLVFLGIEIRQNTSIARANAYQENVRSLVAWRQGIAESEELTRSLGYYTDGRLDDIEDPIERRRIGLLINNVIDIYQNAFYSRSYGIIGDAEWARFRVGACEHFELTLRRQNRFMTDEFRSFLEEDCQGLP